VIDGSFTATPPQAVRVAKAKMTTGRGRLLLDTVGLLREPQYIKIKYVNISLLSE
jgi:hypothetical protein